MSDPVQEALDFLRDNPDAFDDDPSFGTSTASDSDARKIDETQDESGSLDAGQAEKDLDADFQATGGSDLAGGFISDSDAAGGGGFFSGAESICEDCEQPFEESYLLRYFDCKVCDACRDKDGKHGLITKTDACNEYLLRDEDLFSRPPSLKFISKKNPHNARWGIMKLFLRCQIEERALEVWGSEEALEAELEKREEKRTKSKKRTFDKMIKELRMNARSTITASARGSHEHQYGAEKYNEESDVYFKECTICGHVNEYEKM